MEVLLEHGKTRPANPAPTVPALLHAAQGANLRIATLAELRQLAQMLEVSSEAARVAALRNVMGLGPWRQGAGSADQNCGFARLFSALRRTRAELKRRAVRVSAASDGGMQRSLSQRI
jgi:hypothetical protein